ncbi:MAG: hypothetical protein J4G05_04060 [Chlorobi bacterium]|nr:hypothetical protein [Chlorobiota bacterium]
MFKVLVDICCYSISPFPVSLAIIIRCSPVGPGQGDKGTRRGGDKGSLQITDLLGQEILSTEIPVDYGRFVWDASDALSRIATLGCEASSAVYRWDDVFDLRMSINDVRSMMSEH